MMRPARRAIMCRAASREQRKAPRRGTAIMRAQSASLISVMGWGLWRPALFTSTSRRPVNAGRSKVDNEEAHGGIDLGPHGALRELTGIEQPPRFADRQPVEEALGRRAEARRHALHAREEEDRVGAERAGEHAGGEV